MPDTPNQTASIEVLARLLCAADVHVHGNATWQQLSTTSGRSVQDGYRDAARWLLPRMTFATAPAAVSVPPPTGTGRREQLLDALDFAYCQGLGFDTPEALLAAYDASRATPVPPPADQTAEDRPTLAPDPDRDGVILHLPEITYLDTQVWAVDVGLSREALRNLRAVLAVLPEQTEAHRLALSEALGLGTGAPWDAIQERAAELAVLPAPVDRAALLRQEADQIRAHCPDHLDSDSAPGSWMVCHCDVADDMMRRLAGAPQSETEEAYPPYSEYRVENYDAGAWQVIGLKRKTLADAQEVRDRFRRGYPDARLRIIRRDESVAVVETDPDPREDNRG